MSTLALMAMMAMPKRPWTTSTGLVIYAIVMEFLQMLVPPRSFQLIDLFQNLTGVGWVIFAALVLRLIARRKPISAVPSKD